MEIAEAIRRACQILYEERNRPTIEYRDMGVNWVDEVKKLTENLKNGTMTRADSLATMADGSRRLNIWGMRNQKSRTVSETPQQYVFGSVNYGLLLKVFAQVLASDRAAFIDAIVLPFTHKETAVSLAQTTPFQSSRDMSQSCPLSPNSASEQAIRKPCSTR
jgi:hypothetical protein